MIERKTFEAEVKEFDEKDLTVVHFISTERKDRGGDIMEADGMRITGRPVVLFSHGFNSRIGNEPIAKPIWIRKGEFKGRKGIMAKTQFFPDEDGKRLWAKATQGYMPNWSIGYIVLKKEDFRDGEGFGRRIKEWELLEYSPVGVPMNPDAQVVPSGKDAEDVPWFKFARDGEAVPLEYKSIEEIERLKVEARLGEAVRYEGGSMLDAEAKPYPAEHACRLEDPKKYDRFRRQNDSFGDGIHAIWGIKEGKPVELQAIRFNAEKFTAAEARAWCREHKYECRPFEPASGKAIDGQTVCDPVAEVKGAIPYKKHKLAPEDEPWDAAKEVAKAEVDDLKEMCAWYDSENPDLKGSYKLPHHKADGYATVWNAVRAAAAVIMGARGGAKIPASDMPGVKRHIAGHYKDFDKGEPPWESSRGKDFLALAEKYADDPEVLDALARKYIPELSEFFDVAPGPQQAATSFEAETLKRLETRLTALTEAVSALVNALPGEPAPGGDASQSKQQAENPPVGEDEEVSVLAPEEPEEPRLVVDIDELQRATREIVKDALRTAFRKLTGKVD